LEQSPWAQVNLFFDVVVDQATRNNKEINVKKGFID